MAASKPMSREMIERDTFDAVPSLGLQSVEIEISGFSPLLGARVLSTALPPCTHVVCVTRQGYLFRDLDGFFLEQGDLVRLLTSDVAAVKNSFQILDFQI